MRSLLQWYRTASPRQSRVLLAALLGWGLDGMDIMLYAFALTTIQQEFHFSGAQAGWLASVTLLGSALGGLVFGFIADRYGRVRALIYSILAYSLFTAATATAHSGAELLTWRFLVGIGLGGEWVAGSVLVAEVWESEHRGKAIGVVQCGWALGYIAAAVLASAIIPGHGWRPLFIVGVAPALLTLWIRRNIPEPELWSRTREKDSPSSTQVLTQIFAPPFLTTTLYFIVLSSLLMFAYWGYSLGFRRTSRLQFPRAAPVCRLSGPLPGSFRFRWEHYSVTPALDSFRIALDGGPFSLYLLSEQRCVFPFTLRMALLQGC